MIHRPRAISSLLVALLLSAAMPAAAIHAAEPTPLDTNLLTNAGFGKAATDVPIPGWTVDGDVHTETFGTKAWPYPAYGRKWGGGKRYLTCGKKSGLVRQTVDYVSSGQKVKARVQADFGGTTGHKIRVAVRVTGDDVNSYGEKVKALEVTNHYKVAVASTPIPAGATHIEVIIELMPKAGASSCKMVADQVKLVVMRN